LWHWLIGEDEGEEAHAVFVSVPVAARLISRHDGREGTEGERESLDELHGVVRCGVGLWVYWPV
jgi:hypothetical protein